MVISKIKMFFFQKKWKKMNGHNYAVPLCLFPLDQVSVGKATYGGIKPIIFNNKNQLIIGNYCSIGPDVTFIVAADHHSDFLSTYPFKSKIVSGELEGVSKGDIVIEDDVWIGNNATILSGVHIGQGAIIAAGSVVTHNIKPYEIVGGVPAKTIRYRFPDNVIRYMLSLDYAKLDENMIINHIEELYIKADEMTIEDLEVQYKWFPKKQSAINHEWNGDDELNN